MNCRRFGRTDWMVSASFFNAQQFGVENLESLGEVKIPFQHRRAQ